MAAALITADVESSFMAGTNAPISAAGALATTTLSSPLFPIITVEEPATVAVTVICPRADSE